MLNAKNAKMSKSSFLSSRQIHSSVKDRWKRENFKRITLYYNDKKEPGTPYQRETAIFGEDDFCNVLCGTSQN